MVSRLGREVTLSWLSSWAWKWGESRTELRCSGQSLPSVRTSVKRSLQRRAGESAGDVSTALPRAKEQIIVIGTPWPANHHIACINKMIQSSCNDENTQHLHMCKT